MKKALVTAAAIVAMPVMAQAQTPSSGFYIGAEGGLNWLSTARSPAPPSPRRRASMWAA